MTDTTKGRAPTAGEPKQVQTFRAHRSLMEHLKALATADGRTPSQYIERLIAQHVASRTRRADK